MTRILHRTTRNVLSTAVRGEGVYVIDDQNKRYLDTCGGAAVTCLGYSHPAPLNAIKKQAEELPYVHSGFFTSSVAEELADKLVSMTPAPLNHVVFLAGGSEAIETALKLARQYYVEKGERRRRHFISRYQSYHGNTLGALSVGNNPARRRTYQAILKAAKSISPCYPYRYQWGNETEYDYGLRVANELEEKIIELGPQNVIGFIAETVGGATAGVLPPVEGYLKRIRQICDQYDILLILDEVMCGSGRTGSFLSCEQDDIVPDITAIAKGMGAGYQPIAATMCTDKIYQTIHNGSGEMKHGHTYMGHSVACAASLAVLQTIESENLLDNVRKQGDYLMTSLCARLAAHPNVGDIRGRGLFIGIEFVADKITKQPLDPVFQFHSVLKRVSERNGLMCYTGGGTIDGIRGNHVLLAPAYIIDENIVDEIVDRLSQSIDESLTEVRRKAKRKVRRRAA